MRLRSRLALLLLLVIALDALATFILVRPSAESLFRSLVFSGDAEKAEAYAAILSGYRRERGSWEGVQDFLGSLPHLLSRTVDSSIHGAPGEPASTLYSEELHRVLMSDRVILADASGIIVADTAASLLGTRHPRAHLDHGVPIEEGAGKAGTVLVGSMIDSSLSGTGERFLRSLNLSLAGATAASALVALLAGLAFASELSKPLGALARAAKAMAAGEEPPPVRASGGDEVAELSRAFGEMTTELRRLDAAKKRLIADSAHELRTPVTLIQGTVEGMIDGIFPLDAKTLESVHEETLRLSRLIDTLRELETIESGELALSLEGIDLAEAIGSSLPLFAAAATAKSIGIELEAAAPPGLLARGDYLRLGEVVHNLLENAIKYTPEGGRILVRCFEAEGGRAAFSVEDSGPGIPPEEADRVFERFYRLDRSRSAKGGGRGLGLAIVSEIVKAHGGSIGVSRSELGGAAFIVSLPRFDGRTSLI